jgi:predicted SAM-dependent methyltransferase
MGDTVKLNLGCGYRHIEGFINIDYRKECNPDILHDLTEHFNFNDNSVDEIRAMDILEHIPIGKVAPLIEEIYRVLKPGGRLDRKSVV